MEEKADAAALVVASVITTFAALRVRVLSVVHELVFVVNAAVCD